MEKEDLRELTPEAREFLKGFMELYSSPVKSKEEDSKSLNAVLIYEKIRVAIEYQEEHLIFKNAIARIIRRKYTLSPNISKDILTEDLLTELDWAGYIQISAFSVQRRAGFEDIVNKYLILLNQFNTRLYNKSEVTRRIIEWLACELEEYLFPKSENECLLNFASQILIDKINVNTPKVDQSEHKILTDITLYQLLFKPDLPSIEFFLIKNLEPGWKRITPSETRKIAHSFEPFYNRIVRFTNHSLKNRYLQLLRPFIPPFLIIQSTLLSERFTSELIVKNPSFFIKEANNIYRLQVEEARAKILRGSIRALVFIFITKILLALLLEIPIDRYLQGHINYLSLIINISLPPIIMLMAGIFTRTPSRKNAKAISKSIEQILFENRLGKEKKELISTERERSLEVFNFLFVLFNLGIVVGTVLLLLKINFSIFSVLLFFFFMSLVSFFSFRIRNIALNLVMEREGENFVAGIVEFAFLPFIKMGKYISSRFASFNPAILIIDLLIEAPFKTIVRFLNLWKKFISAKKEELEI